MAVKVKRENFGLEDVRDLLDQYFDMVKDHYGSRLLSIAVFGSIVRGEARSNSDIDILIVAENLPEDVGRRIKELAELKFRLKGSENYWRGYREGKPRLISEVILTPEEVSKHPPILLDIAYEGVIVYDRDNFLEKELEKIRRRLKELGAKRVEGRGGWYWVLKPNAKPGEVVRI